MRSQCSIYLRGTIGLRVQGVQLQTKGKSLHIWRLWEGIHCRYIGIMEKKMETSLGFSFFSTATLSSSDIRMLMKVGHGLVQGLGLYCLIGRLMETHVSGDIHCSPCIMYSKCTPPNYAGLSQPLTPTLRVLRAWPFATFWVQTSGIGGFRV